MNQAERRAWLGLALTEGLGGQSYRALLAAFGGPEQIYAASGSALKPYLTQPVIQRVSAGVDGAAIAPALRWLDAPGNHLVTLADSDYPQHLLEIPDPPPLLYLKGRRELLGAPMLAIVGSRNATPQGAANAEAFANALAHAGLTIVSGLALGIDAAAHRGAASIGPGR